MEANSRKQIKCIVKLGGAAVTFKNELETINSHNLHAICAQLRESMIGISQAPQKTCSLDWSRNSTNSHSSFDVKAQQRNSLLKDASSGFVIVHGAGSFGHFQASASGVQKGRLNEPLVKAGLVATRISVTTLNLEIVRALAQEGIPSIGLSPFSCGWSAPQENIDMGDSSIVRKVVEGGLVPVLHGDGVWDESGVCSILSGDTIIRHLARHLNPQFVVFLTDVLGVYDRPPSDPNARLLREIVVKRDGSWSVASAGVKTSVVSHDTTGGMATKIAEAAAIAKHGTPVFIVKAGSDHSLAALSGQLQKSIPNDWLGTVVKLQD